MKKVVAIIVLALLAGLIIASLSVSLDGPEFCRLEYLAQSHQYMMVETGRVVEIANPQDSTGFNLAQCIEKRGYNNLGQQVLEIIEISNCQ